MGRAVVWPSCHRSGGIVSTSLSGSGSHTNITKVKAVVTRSCCWIGVPLSSLEGVLICSRPFLVCWCLFWPCNEVVHSPPGVEHILPVSMRVRPPSKWWFTKLLQVCMLLLVSDDGACRPFLDLSWFLYKGSVSKEFKSKGISGELKGWWQPYCLWNTFKLEMKILTGDMWWRCSIHEWSCGYIIDVWEVNVVDPGGTQRVARVVGDLYGYLDLSTNLGSHLLRHTITPNQTLWGCIPQATTSLSRSHLLCHLVFQHVFLGI